MIRFLLKGEFEVPEESTAVKDLGNSKWLKNSDDEIDSKSKSKTEAYQCTSALTKHVKSYGWSKKSVHWSDQVCLCALSDISHFQIISIYFEEHDSLERSCQIVCFY